MFIAAEAIPLSVPILEAANETKHHVESQDSEARGPAPDEVEPETHERHERHVPKREREMCVAGDALVEQGSKEGPNDQNGDNDSQVQGQCFRPPEQALWLDALRHLHAAGLFVLRLAFHEWRLDRGSPDPVPPWIEV